MTWRRVVRPYLSANAVGIERSDSAQGRDSMEIATGLESQCGLARDWKFREVLSNLILLSLFVPCGYGEHRKG